MALTSMINIIFAVESWYYIVIATVWCTVLQLVLDGLVAIIINKMPDRLFGVENRLFHIHLWERRMYKFLKVRKWADKVLELGGLGGFSKKFLADPDNPEYIEKFIIESNKGVLTHRLSYPIGFLAMLTLPSPTNLTIALPVATVNLFLNVLPTLVLRHNTPMLKSLLKRLKRNDRKE